MNWITATSLLGASASLMLGLIHFLIWIGDRKRWVHLLFVATTVSIAGIAVGEVAMSLAQTPEQFGQRVQWTHVPIALAVFSIIWFVRLYSQAGRLWLAWSACAVRLLALILNFLLPPNLNYRSISSL